MSDKMNECIRTVCRLKPACGPVRDDLYPGTGKGIRGFPMMGSSKPMKYEIGQFSQNSKEKCVLRLFPVEEFPFESPNEFTPAHDFVFDRVLDAHATQEDVFDAVAKPVISSFLSGVNCCIFCYGQTSAGKTYTASGGSSYRSRGIIQRSIEAIFQRRQKLHISCLEIYNECAYDLLNIPEPSSPIESWPRLSVQEDRCRNLTLHSVSSVDEAMDVFLFANMNRVISSTPMNEASSRSHCVFSLHAGACKLNIVDLAGSERHAKFSELRTDTKYINKSLHFLAQVISALEKNSAHIPYRNSILTSILRDSLGGDCRTVMVANLSTDWSNFRESLATCRFATRCGEVVRPPSVAEDKKKFFPLKPTGNHLFSIRELLELSGSDLSMVPKEDRRRIIDTVRTMGMQYKVSCVGELCALIQALVAKLSHSEEQKQTLKERICKMPAKISIQLPPNTHVVQQWKRAEIFEP
jgi:hypothetical protein